MTVDILVGDVRAMLGGLPDDHFDCIVTSPPYWGLRDYDVAGQIGLEPTLGEHLDVMVSVFRELRRVLKPTGCCWLNYGDCYATAPNGRSAAATKALGNDDRTFRDKPFSTVGGGIKPKDLLMIPNRLAIALCDDGWWVRSEIIWGKTNPMPDSSGTQRPSIAHEKIFLLTKSNDADVWRARDTGELSFCPDLTERAPLATDPTRDGARWIRIGSYYDANSVRCEASEASEASEARWAQNIAAQEGSHRANAGAKTNGTMKAVGGPNNRARGRTPPHLTPRHEGHVNHTGLADTPTGHGRLLRNYEPASLTVWEMGTQAFSEAHFATFPPELAHRCLRAGCPPGGKVLDPFGGAGTVGLVADRVGLDCTLIELSQTYAEIARKRIAEDAHLLTEVKVTVDRAPTSPAVLDLFDQEV
jgi:DNA modification methylase